VYAIYGSGRRRWHAGPAAVHGCAAPYASPRGHDGQRTDLL